MKSKTKLNNILFLLGCSIIKTYAAFPQCTSGTDGNGQTIFTSDKSACISSDKLYIKNTATDKFETVSVSDTTETYHLFDNGFTEITVTKQSDANKIEYLINCKSANSVLTCKQVTSPELYDISGTVTDVYLNAYESEGSLKFQYLKKPAASGDPTVAYLNSAVSGSLKKAVILCDFTKSNEP